MTQYKYEIGGIIHDIPFKGQDQYDALVEAEKKFGEGGMLEVDFQATETKSGMVIHKTFQEGGHRSGK